VAVQGNDARLSDARTPTAHNHAASDVTSGVMAQARLPAATESVSGISELAADGESASGKVVQGNDARLSNSRTPSGAASGDLGGTYPSPTVNDGADSTAIHDNISAEISAIAEKTTPHSDDLIIIEDSEATNAKKRVKIGNLPGGAGGGDLASVAARRTTTFAVPQTPTWTDITLDTTDVENDTAVLEHDDTNTERIVAKETGLYLISYGTLMDSPPDADTINLRVLKNGAVVIPQLSRISEEDDEDRIVFHAVPVELTANDYITFQVNRNSATAFNLLAGTVFTAIRMRGSKGETGAQGATGSGSNVTLKDEGTSVPNTPHDTLNFTGSGVTVTDEGGGQAKVDIPGGGSGLPSYSYDAITLDSPINSDWAVNALAPAVADSNNAGLTARRFDDTAEEGVGLQLEIPSTASNIIFKFKSRAETAPGAARTVGLKMYERGLPNNGAVDAWSSGLALNDIDIPASELWQYDSQTIPLATLGLTAGQMHQFELTRVNPQAGTELSGDWTLLQIMVEFS